MNSAGGTVESRPGPEQPGDQLRRELGPPHETVFLDSFSSLLFKACVDYSHLERENETPFTRENETTYLK